MNSSKLVSRIEKNQFVLIAEIGVNYYDIAVQRNITPMEAAKLMCLEASKSGVHAVKFQSYKAETLAAKYSPAYWDRSEEPTATQFELFKKFDSFGEAEYKELSSYCKEIGIDFCSTAFDFESADYLYPLMDVYKISSSDLTNLPFIEYQARKGKPIIMSVGAGNIDEIREAVATVRSVNDQTLVLCHCVLEYPTPYSDANLRRLLALREEFPDVVIGYSDHCKPDESYDVLKIAYALGAHVIEKHFTLDKTLTGNDHYHAMDPDDAKCIVSGIEFVERILGNKELLSSASEEAARKNARRSIVLACSVSAGTCLTSEMLTFKRPGIGISPSKINEIIGKRALIDLEEDTILSFEMLD